MRRWICFGGCVVLGLLLIGLGLLVPMHLRAVDASVLRKAGRKTPTLIDTALKLLADKKPGRAELLSRAAAGLPGSEKLEMAVTNLTSRDPGMRIWGASEPRLDTLFAIESQRTTTNWVSFTDFMVAQPNRERALALIKVSSRPLAAELLRTRVLTNTEIFPPAQSASGQAFDAALSVCGMLLEEGRLSVGLSNVFFTLAYASHADPRGFEQSLLDLMSLGQRMNWGQLAGLVEKMNDAETLRLHANLVRRSDRDLPVVFSAVELTGNAKGVARYIVTHAQSGVSDLSASLRYGAGAVNELIKRDQRLKQSWASGQLTAGGALAGMVSGLADLSWRLPWVALTLKWIFYLAGGFLLALALHYARAEVPVLEQPLQVRGFHLARESLFALGFLLVVLLLSEPFLAQESQKMEFPPFRVRLPTAGQALPTTNQRVSTPIMNQLSTTLLPLLLFFVLQGLLYAACLVKLAEIRRQRVPPRIKLKLLENEDHLFDAGLYLGFVGTIVSLILFSLGVMKPSLMAAYSSTSFGIVFVSIFKIFHLRPVRRRLLLEAEAIPADPALERTLVASS